MSRRRRASARRRLGVNREGQEVAHPDHHPSALALEPDQNHAFEHWTSIGARCTGPKFAYAEPGTTNDKVLRYDQVHGSPPDLLGFRPPYGPWSMAKAGSSAIQPRACQPTGVRTGTGSPTSPTGPRRTSRLCSARSSTRNASSLTSARPSDGHPRGGSRVHRHPERTAPRPVSLVKIHRRRPALSREAFQARWLSEHADLVAGKPATAEYVRRYAQLHRFRLDAGGPGGFKDRRHLGPLLRLAERRRGLPRHRRSAGHRGRRGEFADPEASEFWTARELQRDHRLMPELATER